MAPYVIEDSDFKSEGSARGLPRRWSRKCWITLSGERERERERGNIEEQLCSLSLSPLARRHRTKQRPVPCVRVRDCGRKIQRGVEGDGRGRVSHSQRQSQLYPRPPRHCSFYLRRSRRLLQRLVFARAFYWIYSGFFGLFGLFCRAKKAKQHNRHRAYHTNLKGLKKLQHLS